jgi:hypothetical protein
MILLSRVKGYLNHIKAVWNELSPEQQEIIDLQILEENREINLKYKIAYYQAPLILYHI